MIIKDLQRNKKNRNFISYLRKVVESYRAGLVSSSELTGMQMDFKRVRQLNAECRQLSILSIIFYHFLNLKKLRIGNINLRILCSR